MKESKGITLVALVITIIVLIILAGISISIVMGNNGLVPTTKKAAENYQLAANEEQTSITNLMEQLNSSAGGNGSGSQTTYAVYTLGQEVTVGGEQFFVIEENDTVSKNTITLISKYNLNPNSNVQLNAEYATTQARFCTDPDSTKKGYWYEEGETSSKYPLDINGLESERATVYNKAKAYGESKGGTGRLLTKTEAETFTAKVDDNYTNPTMAKIIFGQDYATNPVTNDNFLLYWLGTAANKVAMYNVYNYKAFSQEEPNEGTIQNGGYVTLDNSNLGIRPVITVSKDLVS